MKVGVRLFLSSAIFGFAIAIAYWFTTYEVTGTLLLGIMGFALSFVAGYIVVAEREARLAGDRKDGTNAEAAGERVGTYALRSKWPFGIAVAVALLLLGAVFNAPLGIAAFLAVLACLGLLIRESRP
jgi:hypothetical protein